MLTGEPQSVAFQVFRVFRVFRGHTIRNFGGKLVPPHGKSHDSAHSQPKNGAPLTDTPFFHSISRLALFLSRSQWRPLRVVRFAGMIVAGGSASIFSLLLLYVLGYLLDVLLLLRAFTFVVSHD